MPYGQYLVAGAEGSRQERLRKSELAALMERWRTEQDLQERQFGFRKDAYKTAQDEAVRARAEAAMRQGIEELPLEGTLAQPTQQWRPPLREPSFNKPKLNMGAGGQPLGVGSEEVPRFRASPQQNESLVKSAAAAKMAAPGQEQPFVEALLRSRREKAYGSLGSEYQKAAADPEWYKARTDRMAAGAQEKETAYKIYNTLKQDVQAIEDQERQIANQLLVDPQNSALLSQLEQLSARKEHGLRQLRQSEEALKRFGVDLSYQSPQFQPPPPSRDSPEGLRLAPEGLPHGLGRQLSESYKSWEDLVTPEYGALPLVTPQRTEKAFQRGMTEPTPYKSQKEAKPKGIPAPAQQGAPGAQPTQRMGPQSSIGAGQADLPAMIAMLDEAMPWLSDEQLAELVQQNIG